ncbi:MAG TPA: type IV toxin-antitoxin system AbiEi family antitoxin domain-containing protein, partial [Solirubrobacteraceae bacterium]|nr:type IV toxin-antitoxin system AbiEi family antitoxin domain-containing protein [Solirubrobacteraceae bacterium]
VIRREQLRACGLSDRQIAWRVHRGFLQRLFRGVYLAGYAPPTLRAKTRAAALSCGQGAFVGHRAAAALYLPRYPAPEIVDIVVAGRNPGARPGIGIHRVQKLPRQETRWLAGIPTTSPARVVLDLAAMVSEAELAHVLQELHVARLVGDRALRGVLAAHPRHPGAARLAAMLHFERHGQTRSNRERSFARIIAAAGLPVPRRNQFIEGELVDAVWDKERLVAEVDGDAGHAHAFGRAADRRRDAKLAAAGWRVIRFTAIEVDTQPLRVAARLAQALAAAA